MCCCAPGVGGGPAAATEDRGPAQGYAVKAAVPASRCVEADPMPVGR